MSANIEVDVLPLHRDPSPKEKDATQVLGNLAEDVGDRYGVWAKKLFSQSVELRGTWYS